MMPNHTDSQDFRAYLRSLWRWKFLVLAVMLVIPAISFALESRKQAQYSSSVLVQPQAIAIDPTVLPTTGDENILAVARLLKTRTIATAAGKLMQPPEPGAAISGLITVEPDIQTEFLTITATTPDPQRSADVANAFARAIAANRAATVVGLLTEGIKGLRRQLARLRPQNPRALPDPQRSQITDQIQKMQTARAQQRPDQGILESAVASTTQVGRDTKRAIQLGIVIALLLSVGAVALAESSDRRLRSPDDLEDLTGLPLLSTIPTSAFTSEEGEESDEEAFQMLRAALLYFNVDQSLKSVVIASAGQEDGKTTVAIRLAYALARSGSDVILVDADIRHPRISARLGLPLTDGFASVLAGNRLVSETLLDMPIRSPGGPDWPALGRLRLLPAGASAPNPAELLSSAALGSSLATLERQADIVIIDSAAALAVSDTLPILQLASGVVFIARLNRSTKVAIRRLHKVTSAAGGTILGVVATGASPRGGYSYGYGYAPPTPSRSRWRKSDTSPKAPPNLSEQIEAPREGGRRASKRESSAPPEQTADLGPQEAAQPGASPPTDGHNAAQAPEKAHER